MNKPGAENYKKYANLGPLAGDIRTIFVGSLATRVTSMIADLRANRHLQRVFLDEYFLMNCGLMSRVLKTSI